MNCRTRTIRGTESAAFGHSMNWPKRQRSACTDRNDFHDHQIISMSRYCRATGTSRRGMALRLVDSGLARNHAGIVAVLVRNRRPLLPMRNSYIVRMQFILIAGLGLCAIVACGKGRTGARCPNWANLPSPPRNRSANPYRAAQNRARGTAIASTITIDLRSAHVPRMGRA